MTRRLPGWWLAAVTIALFAVLALSTSLIVPTFEFLDERDHYAYIRSLWVDRSLPVLNTDSMSFQQYYQPPLYHTAALLTAALFPKELEQPIQYTHNIFFVATYDQFSNDNKNLWLHTADDYFPFAGTARAVHAARLTSVVFGVLHGLVLYQLGKVIFGSAETASIFAAVILLLPGFVSISGVISNDNAAALSGSLLLLSCLWLMRQPDERRGWVILAGALSLATLSKLTTLFLLPAAGLTLLFAWRASTNRRGLVINVVLMLAIWLAAVGWWFWRNWVLYGDPTAVSASREQLGQRLDFSLDRLWMSGPVIWETFIGRFANTTAPMPAIIYDNFAFLCILGVLGCGIYIYKKQSAFNLQRLSRWLVIALAAAGMVAAVCYHAGTNNTGAAGRLVYPGLAAIVAIVITGLRKLVPNIYRVGLLRVAWLAAVVLSCIAVFGWTLQAHALPTRLATFTPPANFQELNYKYNGALLLRGYTLSSERAAPGEEVAVSLYWQVDEAVSENYAVFLQLIDSDGNKISQRETFSGRGLYPTSRWVPGEVVVDTITLTIDPNARAPKLYDLLGGLYFPESNERLLITDPTEQVVPYKLGEFVVAPEFPVQQLPATAEILLVKFSSGITLRGCEPPTERNASLSLFWSVTEPVTQDYTILIHAYDSANKLIDGLDHPPASGEFPTRHWRPGDWIVDRFAVPDPASIARMDTGLYVPDTLVRLPMMSPVNVDNIYELPPQCWQP